MPAVIPFIPLISQGVGLAAGAIGGKKAQKAAQQRSPEEQAALAGANKTADVAGEAGASALTQSKPWLQHSGNYFQTLLHGNRAAMGLATAAPTAQINETYKGAERGLQQSGLRGAAKDVQAGELSRNRAGAIASQITGVQPGAAAQLGQLGTTTMQAANPLLNTAGNVYRDVLGQGFENRKYAREEGGKTGEAIGSLVRTGGTILGDVLGKRTPGTGGTGPLQGTRAAPLAPGPGFSTKFTGWAQ